LPTGQSPVDRLFALSPDLLCLVGADGYFKQLNPAFERTLGWPGTELLARPFIDFVHPDDSAVTQDAFLALLDGTSPEMVENRYRRLFDPVVFAALRKVVVRRHTLPFIDDLHA